MARRSALALLLVAAAVVGTSGFFLLAPLAPDTVRPRTAAAAAAASSSGLVMRATGRDGSTGVERGAVLRSLGLSGLALAVAVGVAPLRPAGANVGEGGLPEVTQAFQRVLRGQREWGKVGQTIADRQGQLADNEWVNTQIFLRNSYMLGEDMRRVVRDAEPDKRTKGIEIAKEFQRLTLDMDKPAKSKDLQGFLDAHSKGVQAFKDFFEVLNDVPDEL